MNCTVLNTMASIKGRFTKASCCNIHLTFPPHQMLVCQVFQGPEPLSRSVGRKNMNRKTPFLASAATPLLHLTGWFQCGTNWPFLVPFIFCSCVETRRDAAPCTNECTMSANHAMQAVTGQRNPGWFCSCLQLYADIFVSLHTPGLAFLCFD